MKDYAAPWFRSRRKLGIDDTIEYGILEPASGRRHRFTVPHEHCDGVGAFMRLYRRLGIADWRGIGGHPHVIPGFFSCWRKQEKSTSVPAPQWRLPEGRSENDLSSSIHAEHFGAKGVSIEHFDVLETQALRDYAKQQKVGLNALLLASFHQVVTSRLLFSGGGSWFVPVTLRGALSLPSDEMNHASGLYVALDEEAKPAAVQQKIVAALKRDEHWWMWHQARIVVSLGPWLVDLVLRLLQGRQHLGSFSSMGEWQVDWQGSGYAEDSLMWGTPPGSPTHPLACCWMICNDRLLVNLKVNAVLGINAESRDRLLSYWKKTLLASLASAGEPANGGQRRYA
ncbi:MAG: hypothetical protein CVV10_04635 [Gammaproteobacteria bacterium HGW-Gammaproteobacteria-14]|nr:MAG: hypothetical protein CVV10_04635 [Gammaproteobacteria bacterium HGW-Gammaproteobacteria-14]